MRLTSRPTDLWCIVLAAGGSRRLGRPKQLVRFRSETLIARTVRQSRSLTGSRVVVVLGAEHLRLRRNLKTRFGRIAVVRNARWQTGLAGSLRTGLSALPSACRAAMILLIDQPLIGARDLTRLVAAWMRRPSQSASARYAERIGVPAILTRKQFKAARRLVGDTGAREILRQEPKLTTVTIDAAAFDLDREADLERLRR
jgi:molybdenum cofactor cytidylyltransferase